jgi:hypothetical protein
MTINRGFNLSGSVTTTETDAETGESTTLVDSYNASGEISTGPIESSTDATGLVLSSDTVAVGEDTFGSLSTEATVTSGSGVSSAEASITTSATGASPELAYSSATSSIDLIGGAEYSFSFNYNTTTVDQDEDGMVSSSTSTAYLYALTVDESAVLLSDPTEDPTATVAPSETDAVPIEEPVDHAGGTGLPPDGNVVVYETDLSVFAQDSYIALDIIAFAVEDQISSVTMSSILIAG